MKEFVTVALPSLKLSRSFTGGTTLEAIIEDALIENQSYSIIVKFSKKYNLLSFDNIANLKYACFFFNLRICIDLPLLL